MYRASDILRGHGAKIGLIRYFVYVLGGFNFACLIVILYWFLQWPILNRFGIQSTLYNFIWTSFAWSVQRVQNVIHLKLWESLRAKNRTFLFCFYFNILPLKKKARAPLKCLVFSPTFQVHTLYFSETLTQIIALHSFF